MRARRAGPGGVGDRSRYYAPAAYYHPPVRYYGPTVVHYGYPVVRPRVVW